TNRMGSSFCRIADCHRICGTWKCTVSQYLADCHVCIEIDLPVVVIVTVGPNRKYRPEWIERQNRYIRRWGFADVWNGCNTIRQSRDREPRICCSRNLRG